MADEELGYESAKLTEEMRAEITEEEPIDEKVSLVGPVEPIDEFGEVETDENEFEAVEPMAKHKSKTTRLKELITPETRSLLKMEGELGKYSKSLNKTGTAIKDIQKQLKKITSEHESAIKNLQRQINELGKKISKIQKAKIAKSPPRIKKRGNKASKNRNRNKKPKRK